MSERVERYTKKYDTMPVVKRYKKLLPAMYPQLEYELASLDELELALFDEYDRLGIPSAQRPYYTAWAKRKGEKCRRFQSLTKELEYDILDDEFITRGLNATWILELTSTVEKWCLDMRLVPELFTNGDFEDTSHPSWPYKTLGWTNSGEGQTKVSDEEKYHGAYSAKFGGTSAYWRQDFSEGFSRKADIQLFEFWSRGYTLWLQLIYNGGLLTGPDGIGPYYVWTKTDVTTKNVFVWLADSDIIEGIKITGVATPTYMDFWTCRGPYLT